MLKGLPASGKSTKAWEIALLKNELIVLKDKLEENNN